MGQAAIGAGAVDGVAVAEGPEKCSYVIPQKKMLPNGSWLPIEGEESTIRSLVQRFTAGNRFCGRRGQCAL